MLDDEVTLIDDAFIWWEEKMYRSRVTEQPTGWSRKRSWVI